jgi:cell wall-associated NlpC family hydrolase
MIYEPRIGDFGVIRSTGLAARAIQLGTISRWNHAFIYIGEGKIIEATPSKGLIISDVSKYKNIAWNKHQELTDAQRQKIVDKARSFLGTTYGFLDILVLALRILGLKILSGTFVEKLAVRQGIICSELEAICYAEAGIQLVNKPEYLVTPGDLAEYLIYQ